MTKPFCVVLSAALLSAGCYSSAHTPRNDGRVSMIIQNGRPMYYKDGRTFEQSPFTGAGLSQAVGDDPAAYAVAADAASRQQIGIALILVSPLALIAGPLVALAMTPTDGEVGAELPIAVTASMLVWATLLGVGAGYAASGMARQYDAVNMYNDRVVQGLLARQPPLAAPVSTALQLLPPSPLEAIKAPPPLTRHPLQRLEQLDRLSLPRRFGQK